MSRCNRFILIAIMVSMLFTAGGCTTVAFEASKVVYTHLRGDFVGIISEKLPDVYSASLSALSKKSGFKIDKKEINTLTCRIIAHDDTKRQIQLDLFRTEYDQTRIQIRIGSLGDKIESVAIYDNVKKYLDIKKNTNPCLF
jgi:hypothetical protein